MSLQAKARPATVDAEATNPHSVLRSCRRDMALLKQDAQRVRKAATTDQERDGVEESLFAIIGRLENTAETLALALDVANKMPPVQECNVLGREADHRIRNSLQTVSMLLHRQATQSELSPVKNALELACTRIEAIGEVHTVLHAADDVPDGAVVLNLRDYLDGLCSRLAKALGLDGPDRTLQVDVTAFMVSPCHAQQLGLIVAELVTNSVRHGIRKDRHGTIWVSGVQRGDGCYQLCVEDDGVGLPPDFDISHRPAGLGLRVVNTLADQVRGRLTADGRLGARFTLTLPAQPM